MNAKKCDRCGKYYDIPTKNIGFDTPYRPDIHIQLYQHNEHYAFDDICQECTQELVDWLNLRSRLNEEN